MLQWEPIGEDGELVGVICPDCLTLREQRAIRAEKARALRRLKRDGYASLMIAAGVNVKALSAFIGHANIRITLDEYGHLLPGAEDEAADLLDAFLARQLGGVEVAQADAASSTWLHPARKAQPLA